MRSEDHITDSCPFCHSTRIIKHGKTSTNNPRFRCRYCKKTWVQSKLLKPAPDFGDLTKAYLSGLSYRDLQSSYHSSPTRINQKIREYLMGCCQWEDYLDACSPNHESRLIHLVGKKFKCNSADNKEHLMFVAMAIDALSSVVLGFEVAKRESRDVWTTLLDRINCRGFVCPTFMSYGSKLINDSIKIVFPYATAYINFTRTCYDNQLKKDLYYSLDNRKLILEAINAYQTNQSTKLENYLVIFKDKRMKNIVLNSKEDFFNRINERIMMKNKTRFEGLLSAFQERFEKFHMLKYNPSPIINGWIAWWMLIPLPIGFSRLSLYLQNPYETHFKDFHCGTLPKKLDLPLDSPKMKAFIIELAVRSLHIPIK